MDKTARADSKRRKRTDFIFLSVRRGAVFAEYGGGWLAGQAVSAAIPLLDKRGVVWHNFQYGNW